MTIIFGRDVVCRYCHAVHPASSGCRRSDLVAEGIARRDTGMALAAATTPEWNVIARRWIQALPTGATFTADDLVAAIGPPPKRNAVGPAIASAAHHKLIVRAGLEQSAIPTSHASIIQLWRRT